MGDFVRVETEAGIATIRLDRPKMNALNGQLQREIGAAAIEVAADPEVRAVVLYGGERIFAAGADVKEMSEASPAEIMELAAGIQNAFKAVAHIPKPVVAAITGYALGGGLELALCADFRVLGESAQVGQPEILLGIIPGAGGTQRLTRLVGVSKAKDLVYSGRFVNATEALAIGLADLVVADADVYTAAQDMAARYVGGAPLALRAAKQAIDAGQDVDLDDGLEIERLHFTGLFATEDGKAGLRSFVENGPGKATFSGK
jgi:enoyl-CoA hydratase/carnithine racemase